MLGSSIGMSNTPSVAVGTTANWPRSGLVCIPSTSCTTGAEYLGYYVVDSTHIQITSRGADGTTPTTHGSPDPAMPAAPTVIAPVPSFNRVIVNATANSTVSGSGASFSFSNDTYIPSCTDTDTNPCGFVILNSDYHTWTANPAAGSTPDGTLAVFGAGDGAGNLTLSGNAQKLQEGMLAADLTTGANLACTDPNEVPFVDKTPTDAMHVHVTCASGLNMVMPFSGEKLQFSGCGYPGLKDSTTYPTPQPWLGNCVATAYLLYGATSDTGAVGTACDYVHSRGWRVYFHMYNGALTVCSKMVFDSGSSGGASPDNNDTADPTSIGIWADGVADKTELSDGKADARTGFLNTGTEENNGIGLTNFNLTTGNDHSLAFAATGRTTIGQLHGAASSAAYVDSTAKAFGLALADLDSINLYYDDPSVLSTILGCASNVLASGLCRTGLHVASAGASPRASGAIGGTRTHSGTDSAGTIAVGLMPIGTNITVTFAYPWLNSPVCFAQDQTTSAKNPILATSVSPTAVTFTLQSAPLAGDNVS